MNGKIGVKVFLKEIIILAKIVGHWGFILNLTISFRLGQIGINYLI